MDRPGITQQTSTTISLRELTHDAPAPRSLPRSRFKGPLQWAFEGDGWRIVRPSVDLLLLFAGVTWALGGLGAVARIDSANAPLLALPPIVLVLFYLRDLYRTRLRALALDAFAPALSAVSVGAMSVGVLGSLINGQVPGQTAWLQSWLFCILAVSCGRILLAVSQRWARARRLVGKPVLIVGAGVVGAQVARRLDASPEYGLVPVGFIDEDPRTVGEVGGRDVPVLGAIDDIDEVIRRTGARNLIVAFSSITDAQVSGLIQRCQELGIEVSVVPRMFDTINDRVTYDAVGGLPLMSFNAVDPRGVQFAIKHAMDCVLALIMLALFSPVILLAALAVRLSSPGPVFFRQRRVGRDGKLFNLYKLRSMREPVAGQQDGFGDGLDFLLSGDLAPGGVEGADRRTAVGRVLRATSIDELPQLLNVLRGDMSLVGPRPERPEFVELFRQDIRRYGDRHRVKSGITGWAQVHGLRGQTSLAERVEWDNYYIAHWSLGLDLRILLLTVRALFQSAE